jgi:hypothetical protein
MLELQSEAYLGFCTAELQIMQPAIQSSCLSQLFMASPLDYLPALENNDLIRIPHGSQPMCDHEHRTVLHQPFDRLLDQPL